MKIEKVNDNQIRCTLTGEDLADRHLKISELAYGTDKAKSLFRDMMQQAAAQFGFEAEDIPLMIEAIPLSADCIILIITKVDDPEELDTRFAKFAPQSDGDPENASLNIEIEGADEILDLFKKFQAGKDKIDSAKAPSKTQRPSVEIGDSVNLTKLYHFSELDTVIRAAHVLSTLFTGYSSLYKTNDHYSLVISKSGHSPETFNKVCNILSEYGNPGKFTVGTEAYLREHGNCMIPKQALQKLSLI